MGRQRRLRDRGHRAGGRPDPRVHVAGGLVGQFWSQVIYFPTIAFVVVAAAAAQPAEDEADPTRLAKPTPITPAGLPGPFVVTQALGVPGIVMIVPGWCWAAMPS